MAFSLNLIGVVVAHFIFHYPLMMSYIWMVGSVIHYFLWERHDGDTEDDMPVLHEYPAVSILVPCHNEGENIRDTLEFLLRQKYPNFEIVAINDGSTDNTLEILVDM
ncbi:MAG: glycosyltransferase [Candidatus Methylumidiphilus sp.]